MKKCIRLVIALLLLYFGYQSSFAQSYIRLTDASGLQPDSSQLNRLETAADSLIAALPIEYQDSFKVFDFGFYVIASQATEGVAKAIEAARISASEVPYYFLIARVPSPLALVSDVIVETKLPETGIFQCLTATEVEIISARIRDRVMEQSSIVDVAFQYGALLDAGLQELKTVIKDLVAGNCCQLAIDQVRSVLISRGFHEVFGRFNVQPALLQRGDASRKTLANIDDYTDFDVGLASDLQLQIDYISSKGYSAQGFITGDGNICSGEFEDVSDDFVAATSDFSLWYHVSVDPETGDFWLFERISDYDAFISDVILAGIEDPVTDCSIPCHATKRVNRCGCPEIFGCTEHWLIETDYVFTYNQSSTSLAEYMIPKAGPNGGPGYADLVDLSTGEIFEIKSEPQLTAGILEVATYVTLANIHCGGAPQSGSWRKGTFYSETGRKLYNPARPNETLVAWRASGEEGVILYRYESIDLQPDPILVPLPDPTLKRIMDFFNRVRPAIGTVDLDVEIARFLRENEDIKKVIAAALVGTAITIVIGTIVEDFVTLGVGLADDIPTFYIAYRLVRGVKLAF